MNWTGGARARANQTSSGMTVRQKQYFAKVRARTTAGAFLSGRFNDEEEGDEGNGEETLSAKQKRVIPEFDIVVGGHPSRPKRKRSVSPIPILGGLVPANRKKQIKARKNKLLEADDWVCTTVAAPLKMVSPPPPKRKRPGVPRPALSFVSGMYQPVMSETETDVREHPDTGFNAFRQMSQGGYVRIGKGRPDGAVREEGMQREYEDSRLSSGSFQPIESEFEAPEDTPRQNTAAESDGELGDSFEPITHDEEEEDHILLEATASANSVREEEEEESHASSHISDVEDYVFLLANPLPSSPPPYPRGHGSIEAGGMDEDTEIEELLRQIDEAAADSFDRYFPRLGTPLEHKRLHSETPSSPTSYVTHFVSRGIGRESSEAAEERTAEDTITIEDTSEEENGESTEDIMIINNEDEEDEVELFPVNPSVVAHASSSGGPQSDEEDLSDIFGRDSPTENPDEIWRKFLQPSDLGEEAALLSQEDEVDQSVVAERGTTMHGSIYEEVASEELGVMENDDRDTASNFWDPQQKDGDNTGDASPEASIPETTTQQSAEAVDINTVWRNFVTPGTKQVSNTEDRISRRLSLPNNLPLIEEVNKDDAWRSFVFGESAPASDGDEDEYYVPPKGFDGRKYTAPTATQHASSSPLRTEVPSHYFLNRDSISGRASNGSSTLPLSSNIRTAKDNVGGVVLEDSMAGNASSSTYSLSIQSSPAKVNAAESMRANPSSSSEGGELVLKHVETWRKPGRFMGSEAIFRDEAMEDIEDDW